MSRYSTILALTALALPWTSCRKIRDLAAEAVEYKWLLVETCAAADQVVIVEHSHSFDLDEPEAAEIIYRTTSLSAAEIARLQKIFRNLDPAPVELISACFTPRHRIEFHRGDLPPAVLEICLDCPGTRFSRCRAPSTAPEALLKTMRGYLLEYGYHKEDWKDKARRHLDEQGSGGEGDRTDLEETPPAAPPPP